MVGDQCPIEGNTEQAPGGSTGSLGGESPGRFRGPQAASCSTAGRASQTEGTACARLERGRGQSTFPGGRAPSAARGWGGGVGGWAGARATGTPLKSMGLTLRMREAEGLLRRLKENRSSRSRGYRPSTGQVLLRLWKQHVTRTLGRTPSPSHEPRLRTAWARTPSPPVPSAREGRPSAFGPHFPRAGILPTRVPHGPGASCSSWPEARTPVHGTICHNTARRASQEMGMLE